jgi:hypothetical protein
LIGQELALHVNSIEDLLGTPLKEEDVIKVIKARKPAVC